MNEIKELKKRVKHLEHRSDLTGIIFLLVVGILWMMVILYG